MFRNFPFWRSWVVVALWLGVSAAQAQTPPTEPQTKDFLGYWKIDEAAGDTCYIYVKPRGRASMFWSGDRLDTIEQGSHELRSGRLILNWDSGFQDSLELTGASEITRRTFGPGQDPSGDSALQARGERIDPRQVGSMTAQPEAPREASPATGSGAEVAVVPLRNPYIGYWEIKKSGGGLISGKHDYFYLNLARNGVADSLQRDWGDEELVRQEGQWTVEGDRIRIAWASGHTDLIEPDGSAFSLASFNPKQPVAGNPAFRAPARQVPAADVRGLFQAGDTDLFTVDDFVGYWVVVERRNERRPHLEIERWGRAYRFADPEHPELNREAGNWKLVADGLIIAWPDGSQDFLRGTLRGFIQSTFEAGVPVTGTPRTKQNVRRVSRAELATAQASALARERAEAETQRQRDNETRLRAEAEARRKAEEEVHRLAEEEQRQRAVAEEQRRLAEEAEARRLAEAEAARLAEAEAARLAAEETRLRAEAEAAAVARRAAEEEARVAAELETRRLAEAEQARLAAENEARLAAEAEARRAAAAVAVATPPTPAPEPVAVTPEPGPVGPPITPPDAEALAEAEAARLAAEARARAEAEEARLATEQARVAAEAAARERALAEAAARRQAEEETRRQAEAVAAQRALAEAEAVRQAEVEARRRAEVAAAREREAQARAAAVAQGTAREDAELRARPPQFAGLQPLAAPTGDMRDLLWSLVWEEKFNEPTLDETRWNIGYPHRNVANQEMAGYVPEAVRTKEGALVITARDQPVAYGDRTMPYSSGVITTFGKFEQAYGYFEIRTRVTEGRGLWPSCWLFSKDETAIRVFDVFGNEPDRIYHTVVAPDSAGTPQQKSFSSKGTDLSWEYHVIGVMWTPSAIVFHLDGAETARVTENIPDNPMALVLSMAVGGQAVGAPDGWTPFPARYYVDWVRVFKLSENL